MASNSMASVLHKAGLGLLLAVSWYFIILASAAQAQTTAFQDAGKRAALVIGVSNYKNVPALPNPANDARGVAVALKRLGFEVQLHIDPQRSDFTRILGDFSVALEDSDIAMFFYAGHAVQIDGINYLAPADTRLESAKNVSEFLVRADGISQMMDSKAGVRITILDACRDNPFIEVAAGSGEFENRGLGRGLANISGPETIRENNNSSVYGSIIAYAAASGRTAADGEGDHSPYTGALLQHIEQPGLEIGQMFRNVAASVIKETRNEQQPEYLVRLTDEVYFRRPEPSQCDFLAAAPQNQVGVPGVEFDRIDFDKAIPACETALKAQPDHPRLLYNLGRAFDAAGRYEEAVVYYGKSAELGFVSAISSYGVMNMNGQGTAQNFAKGAELLKKARALGSRTARISMTSADFSVLFEPTEFKAVQRKLVETGYDPGPIDGDFDDRSKAALAAYQQENSLATNGITLETLDHMGLLGIIPPYELN